MINRYFSDDNLTRVKKHFDFLLEIIKNSFGEFEFSIRENKFNIYYKGNSISLVSFSDRDRDMYKIEINSKFFKETLADNPKLFTKCKEIRNKCRITLSSKELHTFLQIKHLNQFARKVAIENYKEEITLEHSLITDNTNKENFIFIDRQVDVKDRENKQRYIDLLALEQIQGNEYKFVVCEVKLGKNGELKDKVANQLERYITLIEDDFEIYKKCYEKQYLQKKELGLFDKPDFKSIVIKKPVEGLIIVGGYSGIAKPQIESLKNNHPDLKIKHFTYDMNRATDY